jgi:hypothetical protein
MFSDYMLYSGKSGWRLISALTPATSGETWLIPQTYVEVLPVKICTHCLEPKSLDDFHNSPNTKDGKASWCKRCTADIKIYDPIKAKAYRESHREQINTYNESRREQKSAYSREYRRTHLEEFKARDKAYRAKKGPPPRKTPILTTAERFWPKVDKETCLGDICGCHKGLGCCWVWTSSKTPLGYGQFHYKGACYLAHRMGYALMNDIPIDELPEDLKILHKCDVPPCIRHLFPGTQGDNIRDAVQKGRMRPASRLTVTDVQQIRALQGVVPQRLIAEQFGISSPHVWMIQNRRLFKWIP